VVNAQIPEITAQPQDTTVSVNESAILTVEASVKDGGTLSYQWYQNSTNSNEGGSPVEDANTSSYSPSTATQGTSYYYVVVTNTNEDVNGETTAACTSAVATVRVTVDAQTPEITAQPQDTMVNVGEIATLTVVANVKDGGTLSYQWYQNDENSNEDGSPVEGANASSYSPSTASVGISYYYVEVTNTNENVKGETTAVCTSAVAAITVTVDAQTPEITAQPQDTTVSVNESATLTVEASVEDGGTLSYQWYQNDENSNEGGSPVEDANASSYSPSTASAGISYYYVVVTNTNEDVNGETTAASTSAVAAVTVIPLVNAQTPEITAQPQDTTVDKDDEATLTVTASVEDGGTLSYQWYQNSTNSNEGGSLVEDANASSYSPSTASVGVSYYYVVVTNTNEDVNGETTASVTSNPATVTVDDRSGIEDVNAGKAVKSVSYSDLLGRPVSEDSKGFVIKNITYTDNTKAVQKVYIPER
jgi:quinol monooxygenase YgiN